MTTSLPKREADGRSFLESFPRWATDARTVLAVLGIVLYAVLRIAYSLFYNNFGLTPDDLGLSYLDLLIQSAVGTVILLMVMFVVAALVVSVYVGMFGQLRMQIRMLWNNFFRMRHAKSTGSERRPSAKQESESVPPRSRDRPGRRVLAAIVAIGSLAVGVAAVALVEKVVGQQVFVLSFVVISAVWALRLGFKIIYRGLTSVRSHSEMLWVPIPHSRADLGSSRRPHDFRLVKIGEKNRARWVRGLAAIAVATLGFAILLLFARAESDATRVQDGHPSSFTVLGFRVTTWGAEDATVSWTSNQIAADLRPLAGRCLMYLGQSNGTAFLYLVSTHEVFRVPTAVAVVRTRPAVCSRK
jgi:hypothetical protein